MSVVLPVVQLLFEFQLNGALTSPCDAVGGGDVGMRSKFGAERGRYGCAVEGPGAAAAVDVPRRRLSPAHAFVGFAFSSVKALTLSWRWCLRVILFVADRPSYNCRVRCAVGWTQRSRVRVDAFLEMNFVKCVWLKFERTLTVIESVTGF